MLEMVPIGTLPKNRDRLGHTADLCDEDDPALAILSNEDGPVKDEDHKEGLPQSGFFQIFVCYRDIWQLPVFEKIILKIG